MKPSTNPYNDALLWAQKFTQDPETPPTAFIYKIRQELIVMIPKGDQYTISRFMGTKKEKGSVSFSV